MPSAEEVGTLDANKTAALGLMVFDQMLSESGLVEAEPDEDDVTTPRPGRSAEPPRNDLTAVVESARGRCGYCGAQPKSGQPGLSRCGQCKVMRYCGRECSTAHWKAAQFPHRAMCSRLRRAIEVLPPAATRTQACAEPSAAGASPSSPSARAPAPGSASSAVPSGVTPYPSVLPSSGVQVLTRRDPACGGDIVATYLY